MSILKPDSLIKAVPRDFIFHSPQNDVNMFTSVEGIMPSAAEVNALTYVTNAEQLAGCYFLDAN